MTQKPTYNYSPHSLGLIGKTSIHKNEKILSFQNNTANFLLEHFHTKNKHTVFSDMSQLETQIGDYFKEAVQIMVEQEIIIEHMKQELLKRNRISR